MIRLIEINKPNQLEFELRLSWLLSLCLDNDLYAVTNSGQDTNSAKIGEIIMLRTQHWLAQLNLSHFLARCPVSPPLLVVAMDRIAKFNQSIEGFELHLVEHGDDTPPTSIDSFNIFSRATGKSLGNVGYFESGIPPQQVKNHEQNQGKILETTMRSKIECCHEIGAQIGVM